ncbi:MAG: prolyl oligopeptidase family serine peptidase [Planctomycetota bacterium]
MREFLSSAMLAVLTAASVAAPPTTEARPVSETLHGVELTDPYQWLEGDNTDPERMGTLTPEVDAWTTKQNNYTRSVLDGLQPARAELEDRLRELMEVGSVGSPAMAGSRYFFSKREGTQAQSVIYVQDGTGSGAPAPRVLIDPNTLDESGLLTVSWFRPSHDGSLLAFGTYEAGDENSTLHLLDVDSGEWLSDVIPGKVGLGGWLPDGEHFVYRRLSDLDDPYSGEIRIHRVGRHWRHDPVLFDQAGEAQAYAQQSGYNEDDVRQLAATYGPFAYPSRDGRWLVGGYYTGTRSNDLWAADLDRYLRTGELVRVPILSDTYRSGASGTGTILGDTMYMRTTQDAPKGRVVAVDLHNASRSAWREVVPEQSDAVIEGASMARGRLAVTMMRNAANEIRQFALDGTDLGQLDLPGIGSAGLSTAQDRTEAFLTFSSYNEPRSIYRVDLATGERAVWQRSDVPVDPSLVEVKQVWYDSADGTRVSMFVIHRKGLELDGTNPTILYGYGGFNISMTPWFSSTMFPWYENGGVYAVANLRGGGEYGEAWHQGGMLENKQNVFDDFIGAAEWLIANGYTSSANLGISGGSNGGLLTGAVITQRHDLFAAAVSAVPLLDMVRYHQFLMGRYWIPEYGSAENPDQFGYIKAYSPYHNVKPGTPYPATLITAGENDARVHPMHARKMAALMQASTGGDVDEDPILLWVDRDAGHGAGKPLHLRVRDRADQLIFFMWQLGMLNDEEG